MALLYFKVPLEESSGGKETLKKYNLAKAEPLYKDTPLTKTLSSSPSMYTSTVSVSPEKRTPLLIRTLPSVPMVPYLDQSTCLGPLGSQVVIFHKG